MSWSDVVMPQVTGAVSAGARRPGALRRAVPGPVILALALAFGACAESAPPPGDRVSAEAAEPREPRLIEQQSGTTRRLQALSIVNGHVVWASGVGGTWVRTLDGGRNWEPGVVPGADSLEFRDVHAFDQDRAFLLSAGSGSQSRIYRTRDGGRSWELVFVNEEPDGFYDCMDFWDDRRGAVYGDAVGGALRALVTSDGGDTWSLVPPDYLPAALPGEGGFAASGTCLVAGPDGVGWIGTGNASPARVLRTEDAGASWAAYDTPLVAGEGAGVFSVVFRDALHGMVLGGDLGRRGEHTANVAVTEDGGRSWRVAGTLRFPGPAYGAAWVPGPDPATVVAVGPGGADVSYDWGQTWTALSDQEFWAVAFHSREAGWMVGPQGRIVRVELP